MKQNNGASNWFTGTWNEWHGDEWKVRYDKTGEWIGDRQVREKIFTSLPLNQCLITEPPLYCIHTIKTISYAMIQLDTLL